jgi:endonuclease-3
MAVKLPSPEDRAPKILAALKKAYPDAHCELDFKSPFELLIATILSAQCTDVRVNEVTPALFKKYPDAKAYAKANAADLEAIIRPTGFFRNKARSIQNCCTQLVMEHKGAVPEEMDALTQLAGVGRKTANVVRAYAFGKAGIICDTHVLRLSERMGLTKNKDPDKVEADLAKLLQEKDWTAFSTVLLAHGRRCCTARNPSCPTCPVLSLCPFGLDIAG